MVFDLRAATVLTILGVSSAVFAVRAWQLARRIRRETAAAAADLRSGPIVGLAIVALLFWMLAAAAIAIPQWIDTRAGL